LISGTAAGIIYSVEYDVIVVGAGASGMTAALVAANEGASVLVLESMSQVGGTSARRRSQPGGLQATLVVCEAIMHELLELLQEHPEVHELLRGYTFARTFH
jgi:flavin-dependent dehydrogenase